jgi:hypothetical protein
MDFFGLLDGFNESFRRSRFAVLGDLGSISCRLLGGAEFVFSSSWNGLLRDDDAIFALLVLTRRRNSVISGRW